MAKKNEKKFSLKRLVDQIRGATKLATETLYGTDQSFHDENDIDLRDIKNVVNGINNSYKTELGGDILEFYGAVEANTLTDEQKEKYKAAKNNIERQKESLKLQNPDSFNLNEIFSQESGRFQMYNSYQLIAENIPQMMTALNTYVDNILSPDDFTKNSLTVYIKDNPTTAELDKDQSDLIDKCNNLIDHYKLDSFAKKIVTETLKIGDQFVAVLPIAQELNKMALNESDGTLLKSSYEKLKTDDVLLSQEEANLLYEYCFNKRIEEPKKPSGSKITASENRVYNESVKKYNNEIQLLKEDIAKIINDNIIFSEDTSSLLEDNFTAYREFKVTNRENSFNGGSFDTFLKNKNNQKNNKNTNNSKEDTVELSGSVLKILDPRRIIKLTLDEFEYGYYYVENIQNSPDFLTTGTYSINSNIFNNFKSREFDQPDMINSKYRLITDIFVKNISKKINKKFINNNPEFKETIYNLLKQNFILEKQVKITYLSPNDVVHFGIGNDEYKDSIFKPVMFSAKIYLAVLTSQVMLRLVRAPERRLIYLETDLDNDTEQVVQSFIRDFKTKEIKMSTFGQDINTILTSVGCFNDIFVPVVNGTKPFEVETLPGMNVEITNDFLDYLLKTMISGIGVPPEYLSYTEGTEFARSLSMMNGKFVRSVVVYQQVFGTQFSKLFQTLFKNEYLNENKYLISDRNKHKIKKNEIKNQLENTHKDDGTVENNTKKEVVSVNDKHAEAKEFAFNLDILSIRFPSPQSLRMQTIKELSDGVDGIADFITNNICAGDKDEEKIKPKVKARIIEDMATSIEWRKYKKIMEDTKIEMVQDTITDSGGGEDMGGGDTGGY